MMISPSSSVGWVIVMPPPKSVVMSARSLMILLWHLVTLRPSTASTFCSSSPIMSIVIFRFTVWPATFSVVSASLILSFIVLVNTCPFFGAGPRRS